MAVWPQEVMVHSDPNKVSSAYNHAKYMEPRRSMMQDWADPLSPSPIQREREEMLAIYEAPTRLPVPLFGTLAGKSKDQINRELKAGKLLSIGLGNRGQRVPDWQLVPLKHRPTQVLMNQCPQVDSWDLYRMLTLPHPDLGDRAAIDAVTPTNAPAVIRVIMGDYQHSADVPVAIAPHPSPEDVWQSVRRLVDGAVALEEV